MVQRKKDENGKENKLAPRERIIRSLIENKHPQSIMKLSEVSSVDYKNTYNIIEDISEIISKEKIGNTNLVKLNFSPSQKVYDVEHKRTQEFLSKNPKLKLIQKDIEELNYPFMIVLIFGSYVKNTKTKTSDIDICIISNSKEKTRQLIQSLNLLSLKLEVHDFTTDEFISMIEKKQENVGHEIVKRNIILHGIENYYNLISKWMKKE